MRRPFQAFSTQSLSIDNPLTPGALKPNPIQIRRDAVEASMGLVMAWSSCTLLLAQFAQPINAGQCRQPYPALFCLSVTALARFVRADRVVGAW